ncbi:glutamate 5-PUA domain-containing protein [Cryptosporidium ubiquitum]|uniref:Glutamate 5-PUA domain-containing protein n=1 Tax=Cryptosporidium ubiquitum TaxID=857276 RepID=A0A1J4MC40_9CRYT|nr:glutamate 5-PUA domain-containing protein [Cryptosporidium ubiquitum]OII71800.1 glutamate 5-PUA domain-containing protein [Cryptosporidium ubiquitum]
MAKSGMCIIENNDPGPQLIRRERSGPLIVLKVGTSTLTNSRTGKLSVSNIGALVETICDLMDKGCRVVLVSSGAVGAGLLHMNIREKPNKLHLKHAIAAIGQPLLMRVYEDFFSMRGAKVAQLLMTRSDFVNKDRFIDFKNTLLDLIHWNVVPIINENDSVTTTDLHFGDNDTLAAYCAIAISADWLMLATDVDALFTKNPRFHKDAVPILKVNNIDSIIHMENDVSNENYGTSSGTGGMRTKIFAARVAAAAGISTFLVNGSYPNRLLQLVDSIDFKINTAQNNNAISSYFCSKSEDHDLERISKCNSHNLNTDYSSIESFTDTKTCFELSYSSIIDSSLIEETTESAPANNDIITCALEELYQGEYIGTIFTRQTLTQSMKNHKRWIMSLPISGKIFLDRGAIKSVTSDSKSLFSVGVVSVKGKFETGDVVSIICDGDNDEREIARCISNFNSELLKKIMGKKTCEITELLGLDSRGIVSDRSNIIKL